MQIKMNHPDNGGRSSSRTARLRDMSEPELLDRARGSDSDAFEELVGRTSIRLYRAAMRVVHNESDAQEVLQEAYLSAWRGLPRFEGKSQFASWMYRIVVNHSLMHLRTRSRHPEVAIHDVDHGELDQALAEAVFSSVGREERPDRPDRQIESEELCRRIEVAVDSLTPMQKRTFLLSAVGSASSEDIAARLGVSRPAAKTSLHRARKALRRSLSDYVSC